MLLAHLVLPPPSPAQQAPPEPLALRVCKASPVKQLHKVQPVLPAQLGRRVRPGLAAQSVLLVPPEQLQPYLGLLARKVRLVRWGLRVPQGQWAPLELPA